ncbi:MAG: hypothetical protein V4544_07610 [Pseudomonadota bacterium]
MKFLKCLVVLGLGFCAANDVYAAKSHKETQCRAVEDEDACATDANGCALVLFGNGKKGCAVDCTLLTKESDCKNQSSDCSYSKTTKKCTSKWKKPATDTASENSDSDGSNK